MPINRAKILKHVRKRRKESKIDKHREIERDGESEIETEGAGRRVGESR